MTVSVSYKPIILCVSWTWWRVKHYGGWFGLYFARFVYPLLVAHWIVPA